MGLTVKVFVVGKPNPGEMLRSTLMLPKQRFRTIEHNVAYAFLEVVFKYSWPKSSTLDLEPRWLEFFSYPLL
jgi:hypothetical protein